jgi:hypothetical protein
MAANIKGRGEKLLQAQPVGGGGEARVLDPRDLARQRPEGSRLRPGEPLERLVVGQAGGQIQRGVSHRALTDLGPDRVNETPAAGGEAWPRQRRYARRRCASRRHHVV